MWEIQPEERNQSWCGQGFSRVINRARILLKTDEGWPGWPNVSQGTVFNVKRRFAEGGHGVLKDRPQAHRYRKMDDRAEGQLRAA